jgi:hypothetical protein
MVKLGYSHSFLAEISMNINELKNQVLRLDPAGRALLAKELLASLDDLSENEIEDLWLDEAARRDKAIEEDPSLACPAEESLARIRERRK